MRLLTLDRLQAAAHINRWRGWTKRPYSILEHQLIGAQAMMVMVHVRNEDIRAFMVHDMHETEVIGDVPTPDKKLYCNTMFDIACENFDTKLGAELDLGPMWWRKEPVKWMDKHMLLVENQIMSTRPDPDLISPPMNQVSRTIRDGLSAPRDKTTPGCVTQHWLQLWKSLGGADVE